MNPLRKVWNRTEMFRYAIVSVCLPLSEAADAVQGGPEKLRKLRMVARVSIFLVTANALSIFVTSVARLTTTTPYTALWIELAGALILLVVFPFYYRLYRTRWESDEPMLINPLRLMFRYHLPARRRTIPGKMVLHLIALLVTMELRYLHDTDPVRKISLTDKVVAWNKARQDRWFQESTDLLRSSVLGAIGIAIGVVAYRLLNTVLTQDNFWQGLIGYVTMTSFGILTVTMIVAWFIARHRLKRITGITR